MEYCTQQWIILEMLTPLHNSKTIFRLAKPKKWISFEYYSEGKYFCHLLYRTVTNPHYLTLSDTVQGSGTTGSDRGLIQLRSHSTRPITSHALTAHKTALSLWLEIFPLFCLSWRQCFIDNSQRHFFNDVSFGKSVQMNTLCSTENTSHKHWPTPSEK
jgi:hypothetical protein